MNSRMKVDVATVHYTCEKRFRWMFSEFKKFFRSYDYSLKILREDTRIEYCIANKEIKVYCFTCNQRVDRL